MPRKLRIALLSAIPISVLLLPLFVYAVSRAITSGEVTRNVSVVGIELGGLGRDDVVAALDAYQDDLAARPLTFLINDESFVITPAEIGLDINVDAIADAAFAQRDHGFFGGFVPWIDSFTEQIDIPIQVGYDPDALEDRLSAWESEAIPDPAYNGAVVVTDGKALPDYPRSGQGLVRTVAHSRTATIIQTLARSPIRIPTRELPPELKASDIDEAVEMANLYIDSPVTLRSKDPDFDVVFTPEQLTKAFFIDMHTNSPIEFEFGFDRAEIASLVTPFRSDLEVPPRESVFIVNEDDTVTLVPGRSGTLVDVDIVLEAVTAAAVDETGLGELELAEGEPPEFTAEAAQAMMPMTLVWRATTPHKPNQPRVHNIQTMADFIDGAIVLPGDTFSLNAYVGPRTEEKGYVAAPMIQEGKLVDSIGGGVSQFATTLYNAVFSGCYEDVTHKPHSFYISRYPEVNEATVSWPEPNLEFRNDSDALIIIKTSHTSNSISVAFFGNINGRTCERRLGQRHAFTSPKDTFVENAELDPGVEEVVFKGQTGFTNSVVRVITYPDGTTVEQDWSWRYRPRDIEIEVHPCMIEDAEEECPLEVPDTIGQGQAAAAAALEAAGFVVSVGPPINTSNMAEDGIVLAQSVAGGDFLAADSTITIQVGTFVPPPPPP